MTRMDRLDVRDKICLLLQKKYVALLAQRGANAESMVNALLDPEMLYSGMKFIKVSLPTDIDSEHGFEYLFLNRLLIAISDLSGEAALIERVKQSKADCSVNYTMPLQIRAVLDTLGRETSNCLVIILSASVHVADEPLKKLLTMLREYSDQRGNHGTAGDKLRFMVVGDAHLWELCYHRTLARSPFNIAHRMILNDLSLDELWKLNLAENRVTVSQLYAFTGGVPELVEEIMDGKDNNLQDFFSYFHCLQDDWNALTLEAQDALKSVARGTLAFPEECQYDYKCVQIPIVDAPWQDAFWKGFVGLRFRRLTWRSPVHQMFVMQLIDDREDIFRSFDINIYIKESVECLEKAMQKPSYRKYREELAEGAQILAFQIRTYEIYEILGMVLRGESKDDVLKKCQQIAEEADQDWVRELGKEALQHKDTLDVFFIKTVLSKAKDFFADSNLSLNDHHDEDTTALESNLRQGKQVISAVSDRFDVFISYNSKDKEEIIEIDRLLRERHIVTFLDKTNLPPGQFWQPLLEQHISQARSAAVFVGKYGLGDWQKEEVGALLQEAKKREFSVIPIILASALGEYEMPLFLANRTIIDFRQQDSNSLETLVQWIVKYKSL